MNERKLRVNEAWASRPATTTSTSIGYRLVALQAESDSTPPPAVPTTTPTKATTTEERLCTCECFLAAISPGNLPVQASGIALNIVAIASLLGLLNGRPGWAWAWVGPFLVPFEWVFFTASLVLQVLLTLRAMTVLRQGRLTDLLLRQELHSRRQTAGWAALIIAGHLTWARLHPYLGAPAFAMVHVFAMLQYLTCARFLLLCWRKRSPPEPYWFPATVSLAAIGIVGPGIGSPRALTVAATACGCVVAATAWPVCVWRVFSRPEQIAADPSVFVMMAPVPFVTMALIAQRTADHEPLLGRVGMDCLFLLNTLNLLVTLACAVQRRRQLARTLRPFSPAWASLTFPLASNCIVAVRYAIDYDARSSAERAEWLASAAAHWSAVLVPITLVLVPCIDLLWMFHMPHWYFWDRPHRPPSVDTGAFGHGDDHLLSRRLSRSDQTAAEATTPTRRPRSDQTEATAELRGAVERRSSTASAAEEPGGGGGAAAGDEDLGTISPSARVASNAV